jgi:hypothetical protein
VTNTVALQAKALVRVRTANSSIVTTPEHPFARPDGAWTPAGELAPGNLIVSASTAGGVRIENVEMVQAPPTPVYNLRVAPGRAYFVGVERLLVHNTDCPGARNPVQVNDMPEFDGHCAFCTMAALADMSVSELKDRRGIQPGDDGVSGSRFRSLLLEVGAIAQDTLHTTWEQPEGGRADITIPEVLEQFIRDEHDSSTNTFALFYTRLSPIERPLGSGRHVLATTAHSITAVRLEDGSVVYMDFQERPPLTSRTLNPDIEMLTVWPTTTDYRYNRRLFSALRYGRRAASIL